MRTKMIIDPNSTIEHLESRIKFGKALLKQIEKENPNHPDKEHILSGLAQLEDARYEKLCYEIERRR